MDVSVIVVSYNSAPHLRACVESVLRQEGVALELVVVDNHSRDDSLEVLRAFGDRVRVIANPRNAGFGAGNNLGFRSASGRFAYLLNPDARFTSPSALRTAVAWMDAHADVGVAGTRIRKPSEDVKPKRTYPGERAARACLPPLPGEIAWVVGASMIARRDVYEKVGGFDEDFFLYGEETDLCLRVRRAGHAIGFVEDVEVEHVGGAGEAASTPYDVWILRQKGENLFFAKHYPRDAVVRLVRGKLLFSRRRLALLGIKRFVPGLSAADVGKREKYRAIRDESAAFLARRDPAGRPAR